jgi:competence protein ComEC
MATMRRRRATIRRMHAMPVVLSAFAAGVALLQTRADLPIAPWAWIAAALALGAIALMWRSRREAIVAGALAAALAGFGYAAWRAEVRLADALPPAWEGVDLAIVGIVDDLPDRSPQGVRFAFAVERVETAGAIVPRRVSLAWSAERDADGDAADAPEVHAGERWRLTVRLKRPHGYANPGGFDLEGWLLERNLRATGYVRASDANLPLDAFAGRPSDHVQRMRERVRDRIEAALDGAPYAGVVAALAIGDQRAIPDAQWTTFNRTGIGHLVSISGLHVTALAGSPRGSPRRWRGGRRR